MTPAQVEAAAVQAGVDYFCVGPTWPTPTKPGRPAAGLDLTRHAAGLGTDRPWFAIGGIDLEQPRPGARRRGHPGRRRPRPHRGCGPARGSAGTAFTAVSSRLVTYALVLLGCLLGTLPLELVLGVRVYRQARRLVLTLLPVLAVFLTWDLLAVRAGQWSFDPAQVLGPRVGSLPVEEVAFFLVIPTCAVLALEAVRAVRGWPLGDE